MNAKKKMVILVIAVAIITSLLAGCGAGGSAKTKNVTGTLASTDGMTIQVNATDGKTYDFEITADTVLDSDHQPEEGDPIEAEYKEENGKFIAVKATVTSGK